MSYTRKRTTIKTYKLLVSSLTIVLLLLLVRIPSASAVLLISIDMDPLTPGIQSSLTIEQGSMFDIDVVVTGDGINLFDTAIFQVDFNDTDTVLGLTGGPTAGSLAALSGLAIDAFFGPTSPGGVLTTIPTLPNAPYLTTTGEAGLVSLGLPFGTLPFVPLPPLSVTDIFGLNFDTLALGTSTLSVAGPGLAFFGLPAPFTMVGGTVTVTAAPVIPPTPNPIPEPTILMLFGLGLFGLVKSKSRKSTH